MNNNVIIIYTMITFTYNFIYYTWLLIRYRGDIVAVSNTFNSIFNSRKMLKYHFYEIVKATRAQVIDNFLT
jgi:hypothetical protein